MMEVIIIAAVAKNNVIGKDNDLIWHLPRDLKFFKKTTTGFPVIMGRKNYFSIPEKYRPLPNRRNIVLTRKRDLQLDNVEIFHEMEEAIQRLSEEGVPKVFIIGGGQIYKHALDVDLATGMFLTHINESFEGDTFFPEFESSKWQTSIIDQYAKTSENPHEFDIIYYKKVNI